MPFRVRKIIFVLLLFISTGVFCQESPSPVHRIGPQVSPIIGLDYLAIRQIHSSEATYGNDYLPLFGVKYEYNLGKLAYSTFIGYEPIGLTGYSLDNEHTFKFGTTWIMGSLNMGYMFRKNYRFSDNIYHSIFYTGIGAEIRIVDKFLIEPQGCFGYLFERDTGFSSPTDRTNYTRFWLRLNIAYLFPLK